MSAQKPRKIWHSLLILFLVISSVIVLLVFLRITGKGGGGLHREQVFWTILFLFCVADVALFFFLGFLVASQSIAGETEGLIRLRSALGIQFVKKLAREGSFAGVNLFGLGPAFEGAYKGLRIRYGLLAGTGKPSGFGAIVSVYHLHRTHLGLFCLLAATPRFPRLESIAAQPLLARELHLEGCPLKCWAQRLRKARVLFENENVRHTLDSATDYVQQRGGALLLCDKKVSVVFPEESAVTGELIEILYHVSISLVQYGNTLPP